MSGQMQWLFATPPAPRKTTPPVGAHHPVTSFEAAESVKESTVERHYRLILDYLNGRGSYGATDAEMQSALPQIGANSFRARRGELAKRGKIVKSLLRRKTSTGRWADVWEALTC